MREILFKAKRKDNNEWVRGNLIYDNVSDKYWIDLSIEESEVTDGGLFIVAVEVIPETVCQYTGLNDETGKKIFEGDICKGNQYSDKDNLFVIKYGKYKTKDWKDKYICNTYQFGWYAESIESKEQVHLVIPNGIEVIGNKFDDGELIC